MIGKIKLNR